MKIEILNASQVPPSALYPGTTKSPHYDELAEALQETKLDQWVRVLVADIPCKRPVVTEADKKRLQGNVIAAMHSRKVGKVRTSIVGAHLFVTVIRKPTSAPLK